MYSVKKRQPKDRIEQDTCGAVEDYLKDSEQKDNYRNNDDYSSLSLYQKNEYKITLIKNIKIPPILEDDNFISTINSYIKSENNFYKNNENIFIDKDMRQKEFKSFIEKGQINENNKGKDISQITEKVEILEDGSICIKNTTGIASPSLGEKFAEIKNSNIEQEIFTNSKLLVSNNIKSLEENEDKEYMTINEHNLNRKNNNILEFEEIDNNSSKINTTLPEICKEDNKIIENYYFHGVYFSTSKKNKIKSKNNINTYEQNNSNNKNKKKINTNIRKKKLITKHKNYNFFNNLFESRIDENNKEIILKVKDNNNFIREIEMFNNNNNNELNYKRTLFGDNFNEEYDEDIINQWKYLCNKYIKNYNKKLLKNNIKVIIQNLKIQKIIDEKNKSKKKNQNNNNNNIIKFKDNYLDDINKQKLSIKEEYNSNINSNIENLVIQDNAAQSIEYINKNDSDFEFIFKPTNILDILNPPIINYDYSYENIFNEIDNLSEEKIKNIKNESNNKIKKYQGDIESINEEMNESYEEQESIDFKKHKKEKKIKSTSLNNKNIENKSNKNNNIKKIEINLPIIDKKKFSFEINKINSDFNLIEKLYNNKYEKDNKKKSVDSFCNSPFSIKSNKIILPNKKENRNRESKNILNLIEMDNISNEIKAEMSDDDENEIIKDKEENTKIINRNKLINKFLYYKIEKNKDYNKNKIILLFNYHNNNKIPKYSINLNSFKKIIRMALHKKRNKICKSYYESLINIIINNFSIFKRDYLFKYNNKINNINNQQNKEKNNVYIIEINNKIIELEERIKELKYLYIYGIIKKHSIKNKIEKKILIKKLNLLNKRKKVKIIYKELINILNNKINDKEINLNYYQKIIDILKKYKTISEEEIKEYAIKNNSDIIFKNNIQNKNINILNKKKIFIYLLPIFFIINYFAKNLKEI